MGKTRARQRQRQPYTVPDSLTAQERAWMREQMALAGATEKAVHPAMAAIAAAAAPARRGGYNLPSRGYSMADVINGLTPSSVGGFMAQLPRNPRDLAPFGPLNPLGPDPLDKPLPWSGRPEPRLTDYPVAWNVPGGEHRLLSWKTLRNAAESIDVITRCIQVRQKDVRGLKWAWTVTDDAIAEAYAQDPSRGKSDVAAELREKWAPQIRQLTEFWSRPWRSQGLEFAQWVNGFLNDHITLDAVALYPRVNGRGELLAVELIDAATIKPLLDWRGARPEEPYPAYQQVLYGFPRGEFTATVDGETDDGQPIVSSGFLSDQLYYFRENYRSWTPYGWSDVERALTSARLYLKRQGWMLDEYDSGSVPQMYIELPESTPITPQERIEWEQATNDELTGQTGARHNAKVMFPGMVPHLIPSVDERYKPDYDLYMIKLLAMHFGVPITRLGFTEVRGLGSSGMHENQQRNAKDQGETPDGFMIAGVVNDLAHKWQNAPVELEFRPIDPGNDDEAARAGILRESVTVAGLTVNEYRQESGRPVLAIPEADMPFILTGTGPVFLEGSSAPKPIPTPGQPGVAGVAGTSAVVNANAAENATGQATEDDAGDGGANQGSDQPPVGTSAKAVAPDSDAKRAEVTAYRRWARKSANSGRSFAWHHHTPAEVEELTKAGDADPKAPAPGRGIPAADLTKADASEPPAPPPSDERWPAWAVDVALTAITARQLLDAVNASVPDPRALVQEFMEWAAGEPRVPSARAVRSWLTSKGIQPDLAPALRQAWIEGAAMGERAARAVAEHLAAEGESARLLEPGASVTVDWGGWKPGNTMAARKVLSEDGMTSFLDALLRDAGASIGQIESHRLDEIAAVLADGLEEGKGLGELTTALRGVLDDRNWAEMVAWTESNRASSAAALAGYQVRGVPASEWFTAMDQRVCPICLENEAAGPVPLGQSFPSGDSQPPAHPRCRCALLPVLQLPVAEAAKSAQSTEQLHHYWTKGEGLAKWISSPHPWTTLYHHLLKHIGDPEEAKRTASQWFHDATGMWPGERKGKNPLGRG